MSEIYPELKDIKQAIKKYVALNPDSTVVFGFVGYKESNGTCCDCGGNCSEIDDYKSDLGAVGQLEDLRFMLNNLRDCVEDSIDETGFVSHIDEIKERDDL